MNKFLFPMLSWFMLFIYCIPAYPTEHGLDNPTEGVVANIPKTTSWSVTYTYPEEMGTDAPKGNAAITGRIRSVTTSHCGDITHIFTEMIQADSVDTWSVGDEHYGKTTSSTDWARSTSNLRISGKLFPGIEWIKPDLLISSVTYENMECQLYMPKPHPPLEFGEVKKWKPVTDKALYVAIVDAKTHLPVEIHNGGIKEVFDFKIPSKTLCLPDDLTAQISQGKRVRSLMNARAPRPY